MSVSRKRVWVLGFAFVGTCGACFFALFDPFGRSSWEAGCERAETCSILTSQQVHVFYYQPTLAAGNLDGVSIVDTKLLRLASYSCVNGACYGNDMEIPLALVAEKLRDKRYLGFKSSSSAVVDRPGYREHGELFSFMATKPRTLLQWLTLSSTKGEFTYFRGRLIRRQVVETDL